MATIDVHFATKPTRSDENFDTDRVVTRLGVSDWPLVRDFLWFSLIFFVVNESSLSHLLLSSCCVAPGRPLKEDGNAAIKTSSPSFSYRVFFTGFRPLCVLFFFFFLFKPLFLLPLEPSAVGPASTLGRRRFVFHRPPKIDNNKQNRNTAGWTGIWRRHHWDSLIPRFKRTSLASCPSFLFFSFWNMP